MITRLRQWLRGLTPTPKEKYVRWLSEIDTTQALNEDLPLLLMEFWRRVEVEHLVQQLPRIMVSVFFDLRHDNIEELLQTLRIVNDAVSANNFGRVEFISKNEFIKFRRVCLDTYFSDARQMPVDITTVLTQLKDLLGVHQQILENQEESYHKRMLGRLYYDILTITEALVENMVEEKAMK